MVTRLESAHAPSEVADGFVESVADTFDFTRTALIRSHENSAPSLLAWHGDVSHAAEGSSSGVGSTLSAATAARQTLLVSSLDPDADPWLTALLPGATNLVVSPLIADGQAIGVLVGECSHRMGPRIEHRVVAMVERFASYGALALNNTWLLERVQQMAATDGLTGVANRRSFEDTLSREIARASRRGDDLSLLMIDIDHFKPVNDIHGHQMGDAVLRRVAALLADECREFDSVARYGGEEFAVVLPSTTSEQAVGIGDRLRASIAGDLADPRVTVSVGVAAYPGSATEPTRLIAAADEALYASKRNGRDRVTAAPLQSLRAA